MLTRRRVLSSLASTYAASCAVGALGPLALGKPRTAHAAEAPNPPLSKATLTATKVRLMLRHTWTTVMSSSAYRDTCHVSYTRDGITGHGEGAPISRYHETADTALRAIDSLKSLIESADPFHHAALFAAIHAKLPGEFAAKAAIDLAITDWVTQKLGVPLYRYLGLDPNQAPITSMSIGIDSPQITQQKTREAADFPLLKIKVGLDTDEQTLAAVRQVTNKPLRVDANEGWKDREVARRKIEWLSTQGVELIEQPLPGERLEDQRWLRERVNVPIFADECCLRPEHIPLIASAYHGINVKLDKCGGIWPALRMIHTARAHGLRVMLGCMVSSSTTITAAAHLAPLVDYVDLDGNLLITEDSDPFIGVRVAKGRLVLPTLPGLGLTPRTRSAKP